MREIVERGARARATGRSRTTRAASTPPAPSRARCSSAREELDEAIRRLPLELVAGLQVAIANVARGRRRPASAQDVARRARRRASAWCCARCPSRSAAVYVPGGRAPYPSTVVMGVVTARAAGVLDVAVCAPPGADGEIDPAILGTCRLCGVERVYRMGGAQAIAALAYGTETRRAAST